MLKGARPCRPRRWLTAAPRSGAVSASVPSKSNRTARRAAPRSLSLLTNASQQVVDVAVRPERITLRDRVVGHADQLVGPQPGGAPPARELGGLDEAHEVVGPLRQETEDVFRADDREEIGLRIAIERREENLAAGARERCARCDH